MSIIHEALKKAERERESHPRGLPPYGGRATARRSWRRGAAAGVLIGLTIVGGMSTWLWLQSLGEPPAVRTVALMPQRLPALVQEGEAQAEQGGTRNRSLAIANP